MPFNHVTVGTDASPTIRNINFPLETLTLTSVGLALSRKSYGFPCLAFTMGLTPPGDEDIEVYESLLSGLLSPGDGQSWSGSIKIREQLFLVINYTAADDVMMYVTWTTT